MSLDFLYSVLLICIGFVCSRLVLNFLKEESDEVEQYAFYKDPWLYMYLMMVLCLSAVFFLVPNYNDVIVSLTTTSIWIWLSLAFVIYIVFLLETDRLFLIVLAASSLILSFSFSGDALVFGGIVPFWADRLIVALIIFLFTFSSQWLNDLPGIFATQCLTIALGLSIVAIIGGIPHVLGFAGAGLAGVWLGYFHLDWFLGKIKINNGACMAASFIFSGLLLDGALEMAAPSMLILIMYPLTEIVWSFFRRYVFYVKRRNWSENTAYMSIAYKGASAEVLSMAVVKIGFVNVVLACFQLFSVNGFSIPLFAFVVNLWLLGMLYNADEKPKTFKEVNQDFVKNVKEGLKNIKQSVKKGKD